MISGGCIMKDNKIELEIIEFEEVDIHMSSN